MSVVYFRAAYTPSDYPSEKEWKAREMIEASTAIKCPNIAYHLMGTKKMQQVMAMPNVIEEYVFPLQELLFYTPKFWCRYISQEEAALIRSCFTELFSLDDSEHDNKVIAQVIQDYQSYVLKPQREGGGNLIHGTVMRDLLSQITPNDREKYILMKRIKPKGYHSYLLREGQVTEGQVICELGTFGAYIGYVKILLIETLEMRKRFI